MRIAMLHYSNSVIDASKLFGMQVSEINTLNQLLDRGVDATLYAKKYIGEHPRIKEIPYERHERDFHDMPYYTRFVDANRDAHVLQGNATPLLTVFRPEKTLIRVNGDFPFPLAEAAVVREAYNKAFFYFVSNYMKDTLFAKYPFFDEKRCFVLHNAVAMRAYPPRQQRKKMAFLFASRWVAEKGLFVLLDAVRMLNKKRRDFVIYVAGGIQRASVKNEKFNKVEREISERISACPNVENLGYLKNEALLDRLGHVDALIFPSLYGEPFSSLPLQAAVAGLPTIAFDVGSLSEGVIHNATGILIKKSKYGFVNAKRLAKGISLLLDNPDQCRTLGLNAQQHVAENFMWDRHMEELMSIYRRIADG